jgi:hypothetical protein
MMKITREQYEQACVTHDEAQKIMDAYHQQKRQDFATRWKEFEAGGAPFTDADLRYAAHTRCKECQAGLAYPKDAGMHHHWDCSRVLKGEVVRAEWDKHPAFPFVFYEIKSEGQPSACGATTRPAAPEAPAATDAPQSPA